MSDFKRYRDNPKVRELDKRLGELLKELDKLNGRRDFFERVIEGWGFREKDLIMRRESRMITDYEFEFTHGRIHEKCRQLGEDLRFVKRDMREVEEQIANVRQDAAELIAQLESKTPLAK